MSQTPLPRQLIEHLKKEENQLEGVKQELEDALKHIQELEKLIEQTGKMLENGTTVPRKNYNGIEKELKGTFKEVGDADQKLETILEEIDRDRQSVMN